MENPGAETTSVGQVVAGDVARAFSAYLHRMVEEAGAGTVETVTGRAGHLAFQPRADVTLVVGRRLGWLMERKLERSGARTAFCGAVKRATADPLKLVLLDRWDPALVPSTPHTFDVLAITTTYNEIDVIEDLLCRMSIEGIRIHVVDNWSTDGTFEVASRFAQRSSTVTVERFPRDGPTAYFELERLLSRVEELAHHSGADWVVSHDADEVRHAPWPGVSLRRALWCVERFGFNCIDHTVMNFRPIDQTWDHSRLVLPAGRKLTDSFDWFEFGTHHAHFRQRKAWKPQVGPVLFASSGGHDASFPGQRVFPYRFVLRHYPIRSTSHGRKKVLVERKGRWSPSERAKGWHVHYDAYSESSEFLWRADALHRFTSLADLDDGLLVERLSGAGLPQNPYPGESVGAPQ